MGIKIIKLTQSQFTERFLYLDGKPFSFENYEFMRIMYDLKANKKVFKTSRQVGKSTSLSNMLISYAAMHPHSGQLFVAPSADQTKIFSNDRVAPTIETSPLIKKYYINSSVTQNVFTKKFLNHAKVYLRYAQISPDRLRGMSTDRIFWDECQDQNPDNIPIVEQAMSRSLVKESVYTGTPKRTRGTLADLWHNSTMYEWIPKCEHCGEWNFIDERILGLKGPICHKCGKDLNTKNGQWVLTGDKDAAAAGFRISLPMFAGAPWIDWQRDVIDYRKGLPSESIFFNEVLGLEYDTGVTPVTIADLKKCCTGGPMKETPDKNLLTGPNVVGLDYGPVSSLRSKTVTSIVQYRGNKLAVMYLKKYNGPEADYAFIHQDVPRKLQQWNAKVIGADAGLGDGPNSEIRNRIGNFNRLIAFRYSGSQKVKGKWNQLSREYTIGRNIVLSEFFEKIKKGLVIFPRWEDFEPFADDFLNMAIEYDKSNASYKFVNDGPDDAVHSIVFADLALQLLLTHKEA
jgi:hypothetical protein